MGPEPVVSFPARGAVRQQADDKWHLARPEVEPGQVPHWRMLCGGRTQALTCVFTGNLPLVHPLQIDETYVDGVCLEAAAREMARS